MAAAKNERVWINIRKLAALDIAFLGSKFVLAEFGLAVFLCPALGLLTLLRSHSVWQVILAAYLLALGVNYVPLLAYALAIVRRGTAQIEVADEATDKTRSFRRYRRQSLLLLIPFVVPVLAITQERQKAQERELGSETVGRRAPAVESDR